MDENPFANAMKMKKNMRVVPKKMNLFVKKKKEKRGGKKEKCHCTHDEEKKKTENVADLPKINRANAMI